jgi:hypothetical protein
MDFEFLKMDSGKFGAYLIQFGLEGVPIYVCRIQPSRVEMTAKMS